MRQSKITFEVPFSERKAKYVRSLTNYVMDKFLFDTSKISINYISTRNLMKNDGMIAYSDPDIELNSYTIAFDSGIAIRDLLLAVAHELVHVKQFVLCEHKQRSSELRCLNENYFDDPAEIEAYGRELGLFTMWCKKYGLNTKYSWAR